MQKYKEKIYILLVILIAFSACNKSSSSGSSKNKNPRSESEDTSNQNEDVTDNEFSSSDSDINEDEALSLATDSIDNGSELNSSSMTDFGSTLDTQNSDLLSSTTNSNSRVESSESLRGKISLTLPLNSILSRSDFLSLAVEDLETDNLISPIPSPWSDSLVTRSDLRVARASDVENITNGSFFKQSTSEFEIVSDAFEVNDVKYVFINTDGNDVSIDTSTVPDLKIIAISEEADEINTIDGDLIGDELIFDGDLDGTFHVSIGVEAKNDAPLGTYKALKLTTEGSLFTGYSLAAINEENIEIFSPKSLCPIQKIPNYDRDESGKFSLRVVEFDLSTCNESNIEFDQVKIIDQDGNALPDNENVGLLISYPKIIQTVAIGNKFYMFYIRDIEISGGNYTQLIFIDSEFNLKIIDELEGVNTVFNSLYVECIEDYCVIVIGLQTYLSHIELRLIEWKKSDETWSYELIRDRVNFKDWAYMENLLVKDKDHVLMTFSENDLSPVVFPEDRDRYEIIKSTHWIFPEDENDTIDFILTDLVSTSNSDILGIIGDGLTQFRWVDLTWDMITTSVTPSDYTSFQLASVLPIINPDYMTESDSVIFFQDLINSGWCDNYQTNQKSDHDIMTIYLYAFLNDYDCNATILEMETSLSESYNLATDDDGHLSNQTLIEAVYQLTGSKAPPNVNSVSVSNIVANNSGGLALLGRQFKNNQIEPILSHWAENTFNLLTELTTLTGPEQHVGSVGLRQNEFQMNENGDILVAFKVSDESGGDHIYFSEYVNGIWTKAGDGDTIDLNGEMDVDSLNVVYSNDSGVIVWIEYLSEDTCAQENLGEKCGRIMKIEKATTWSAPDVVAMLNLAWGNFPKLTIDNENEVQITWIDDSGEYDVRDGGIGHIRSDLNVHFTIRDTNGDWSRTYKYH